MLVLPIVNKGRVMNAEIRLKKASKIRKSVCYEDAKPSDIIVNREKFSESIFGKSKDVNAPIDFIRSKSLLYPRRFTTGILFTCLCLVFINLFHHFLPYY